MTVILPTIGYTDCHRAEALLEEYPQNVVGSFWVMCGYGFDTENIPDWWRLDILSEENSAQAIVDAFEAGKIKPTHDDPLYLGFCIFVIADINNPWNLSYMIQHVRMWELEGIKLLKIMAKHKIPACTFVEYPAGFIERRYVYFQSTEYKHLLTDLKHWTVSIWEDYCSQLMSHVGVSMLTDFYRKTNQIKDLVKAKVAESTKPLVLTEGETDPIYIKAALALLGENKILSSIDIEWVGTSIGKGKSINTGDGGLNRTRDVLISNPTFLNGKVLLLYDCDTKRSDEDCNEYLKIRRIPKIDDRKVQKGIENLFPDHLFKTEFYIWKETTGDYGEAKKFQEFQKMKFCKWLCEERKNPEDFKDFKIIIDFIQACLGEVTF